jgi:hypothetical protein
MGFWSLASLLITIIVIAEITTGRERTKQLKAFSGSLFRQPVTSHRFWFVKVFTCSIIW